MNWQRLTTILFFIAVPAIFILSDPDWRNDLFGAADVRLHQLSFKDDRGQAFKVSKEARGYMVFYATYSECENCLRVKYLQ